ncbi:MAG TPA: exodeoxyribonuclease VII small subunit [Candidatus Mediterraneibacter vanvlietii]|mgnify:FL=1|nr:exodeoxyribonuclease VII small subunit [Candidatus Mediterraneibacter vanvlietii]
MGAKEEKKENLEQKFQALEEVIEKLEGEDVTLEQSFDLYNKGMTLLKNCTRMIDEVEKKVLVLDENGETHEF